MAVEVGKVTKAEALIVVILLSQDTPKSKASRMKAGMQNFAHERVNILKTNIALMKADIFLNNSNNPGKKLAPRAAKSQSGPLAKIAKTSSTT